MKKFLFLMPFLLAPSLFNCNNRTVKEYTITFDAGEGYFVDNEGQHKTEEIKVKRNEVPTLDKMPVKEEIVSNEKLRYAFTNWSPIIEPAKKDTTYTANYESEGTTYYTVTFETLSASPNPEAQDVKKGDTVDKPITDPIFIGAEFKYWTAGDPTSEDPEEFNFETPINKDITLFAYYKVTGEDSCRIMFNAGSGHFGEDLTKKKKLIIVPEGTKYKEISVPTPTLNDYTFNGYSLTEVESEDGEVISDDEIFNDSTDVYASYSYARTDLDIKLSDDSTTFELGEILTPSPKDDGITVPIKIKDEVRHKFVVPTDKNQITIKDDKGTTITDFTYTPTSEINGVIKLKKNYTNYKLTIYLPNNQPVYYVTDYGPHDNMAVTLTTMTAKRGENYTFKIEAINNPSNTEVYVFPRSIGVYIGDSTVPLRPHCYDIVAEPDSLTRATVTIHGQFVKDKIRIVQVDAIPKEGVPLIVDGGGINWGGDSFIIPDGNKLTLHLAASIESAEDVMPDEKHILYSVNRGTTWAGIENVEGITYTKTNGDEATLEFDTSKITIDENIGLELFLRAQNYQILDDMSWDEISAISNAGLAQTFFYLGDTKKVDVTIGSFPVTHEVQIIDFDHDDLAGNSGKAGITFDFKNLLTTSSVLGVLDNYSTNWSSFSSEDENNRNYTAFNLASQLSYADPKDFWHGQIYKGMPDDLINVAKDVIKKVGICIDDTEGFKLKGDYATKLFPLAVDEIYKGFVPSEHPGSPTQTEGEGTIYAFYNVDGEVAKERRTKKYVEGCTTGVEKYWLRSPTIKEDEQICFKSVFIVSSFDNYVNDLANDALAVAPAFCI